MLPSFLRVCVISTLVPRPRNRAMLLHAAGHGAWAAPRLCSSRSSPSRSSLSSPIRKEGEDTGGGDGEGNGLGKESYRRVADCERDGKYRKMKRLLDPIFILILLYLAFQLLFTDTIGIALTGLRLI